MILEFKGVCVYKIAPKRIPTISIGLQLKKQSFLPTLEEKLPVADGQISDTEPF